VASHRSHGEAINLGCLSALGFLGGPCRPVADRRPADGPGQAIALTTVLHSPKNARPATQANGAVGRL
jgi:hypothetical protein